MISDPVGQAAALATLVLVAERLARTRLRALGSALLVILLGALASNLGVLPGAASTPLYDGVFTYLAPLSIFWLLLSVDLRAVSRAGAPMLGTFALGAAGTSLGAVLGMMLAGGKSSFGDEAAPLVGMFAGTYTGGSLNFNAIALEYGLVTDGGLYAGAVAVDNILTAIWMMACLAAPRVLAPLWPGRATVSGEGAAGVLVEDGQEAERLDVAHLAGLAALGLVALEVRDLLVALMAAAGIDVPGMLVLTALALAVGPLPGIRRLRGAQVLGLFSVQAFLAVIGALCRLSALSELGTIGPRIAILAFVTVGVHGLVLFAGARLARIDLALASVASQANVGGGTTAMALARSLGRPDLAVPGILAGSLGTAAGTFIGFALVRAYG